MQQVQDTRHTAASGQPARAYHHGALAQAMVQRALLDVRLRGADHVSLRGVAHALDVSPSAAYNHFADKEALLGAVGSCGVAALDERMTRAMAAHPGDAADALWARFAALGRSYVAFAAEDPHLFRLTFSPVCAAKGDAPASGPYQKLTHTLDELESRRLLRDGIRPGLDTVVWSATHGTACLIVEGMLPLAAVEDFIGTMRRMMQPASH